MPDDNAPHLPRQRFLFSFLRDGTVAITAHDDDIDPHPFGILITRLNAETVNEFVQRTGGDSQFIMVARKRTEVVAEMEKPRHDD